jgi:DNA polymerase-3 subunit delta
MTAQQFLTAIKQREPAAAYLFIGPEPYQREFCRRALIQRVLPGAQDRDNGLIRHDLDAVTLGEVLEDARSPSLFAPRRVLVVSAAESALPRARAGAEEAEEETGPGKGGAAALAAYLKDPSPDVVLIFEAGRYGFEGEEKRKIERVRKFYAAVPAEVEFPHMSDAQARHFAQNLATRAGLKIGSAELDLLVDDLGGEAARIAAEIEKLTIYAGAGEVGADQISELVPEARESTIFALVGALGRNDRAGALDILDTLVRQSEYLPLALSFLGTQFRLALAAREAGLRSPQAIQAHFAKQGVQIWGSRAEQVYQTVSSFSKRRLAGALKLIFEADKALRDTRPDDRVVMEEFILRLTASTQPS